MNKAGFTNQTKITWEELKDIPKICQGIQVEKKTGGYHIQKDACVFWSQNKGGDWSCLIFTKENIDNDAFAMAIKRCYRGN